MKSLLYIKKTVLVYIITKNKSDSYKLPVIFSTKFHILFIEKCRNTPHNKVGGVYMRRLRLKARLTQEQLAVKVGISQVYVSKIENGYIKGLTIDTLVKIANCLEIRPEKLLRALLSDENNLNE